MENLDRILREMPFFKGIDAEQLAVIAGCATNVHFKVGEFIFREGGTADKFYVIRQGGVAIDIFTTHKGPVTLQTIGEGDALGWAWLIPPHRWHSDARVVIPTRAIALDGTCLRGKCEEDKALGYELMKRFAHVMEQRLQATRLQLLDLYSVHD
jgi:CRP-like cAMP-binding protein